MNAPKSQTLADLIEELAATRPDRPALSLGEDTVTFAQFRRRAIDFAKALQADGVRAGDKIGLLMGNRIEWLVAAFATQYLGAVLVPMNTWYTAHELEYVLDHGDITVLVTVDRFLKADYIEILKSFGSLKDRFPLLRTVVMLGEGQAPSAIEYTNFIARGGGVDDAAIHTARGAVSKDDIAFILYTSGSTARPKGVMLGHDWLIRNPFDIGERLHFDENDVLLLPVSLFWGLGCENGLPAAWTHGMHVVLQEQFNPDEAISLIQRYRCTALYGTPNMVEPIANHPDKHKHDLSFLRKGISPGHPEAIVKVIESFMPLAVNCFGLTETYGFLSVGDAADPVEKRAYTHGRPVPGADVRIISPETGRELPRGEVGEIRQKGTILAGYYKSTEATDASLDENGYFKTGDLALIDEDGYLVFKGRLKEMIKTGGMNVPPAEVEAVLMAHPSIAAAFVTGLPDAARGELVAAIVVLKVGDNLEFEAVLDHCKTYMAAYKVPRLLKFAVAADIPLTTTGKLHRARLAEFFA